jgi:preprotein translocase subunit SecE
MGKLTGVFGRIRSFLRDVRGELKKVSWPTRQDMYKTTLAVVILSVFFGLYLFATDFVFSRLIKKVIGLLQ